MDGFEPPTGPEPTPGRDGLFDWNGVTQGLAAGLAVLALAGIASSVADRMSLADATKDGVDAVLVLVVMAGYSVAGTLAGRRAPRAPLANGWAAAVGAFAVWVPLRILIWALRGDDRALVSGHDAVFSFTGVYAEVLAATVFGMLGAWLAARRSRAHEPSPR
jgi:hypothetical protein